MTNKNKGSIKLDMIILPTKLSTIKRLNIMKAEYFSEERRCIREEWGKTGEGVCWFDFLYLFSGRAENGAGEVCTL